MPYNTINDLPDNIRRILPKHAQEIYKEAFNHAWEEYAKPSERKANASRDETAYKVAWSSVEQKYLKNSQGNWVKK